MRYANLFPASHISRSADPRLTADARRIFTRAKAAVVASTESAKRFAATVAPLVIEASTVQGMALKCLAVAAYDACEVHPNPTNEEPELRIVRQFRDALRAGSLPPLEGSQGAKV
jgi:hypothetical protein